MGCRGVPSKMISESTNLRDISLSLYLNLNYRVRYAEMKFEKMEDGEFTLGYTFNTPSAHNQRES